VTARTLVFLMAHDVEAPRALTDLTALSGGFDSIDGPLDPQQIADTVTDLLSGGSSSTSGPDLFRRS